MEAPLLSRALALAVTAHEGQRRKGGRAPYAVHPLRVVGRVHAWGLREDEEVLAAAALHDAVEDTRVTEADVEHAFGPRVADLVRALTHDPRLPPRERTRVILEALERAPLEAVVIKLADRLDNIHEMEGWRASSRLGYLGEARAIGTLAKQRLAAGEGPEEAHAALARALDEYDAAVEARVREAEHDLRAGRERLRRRA